MSKGDIVFDLTIEVNGEKVFDKPVGVRRFSELNGVIKNNLPERNWPNFQIGDQIEIRAKREF